MFLMKSELPVSEKTTDAHPWARSIKDKYGNKMKYAHNSIRNPEYPKKKENQSSNLNRIKFTIIGDRVTKPFIYCSNLVKGLYKYRKMIFDAPVIQGVTTVEWPTVWNDLKTRYGGSAYCLRSPVAVLINNTFLGGEDELKELIESKFTYHLSLNYYKESVAEFAKFIRGSGRPCVYMKISIDGKDIGSFIFMVYSDILPNTSANFLRLCKDTKGGYSGTPIHRIVKDGWIQCGGYGLKETDLDCENFIIPHDRRGVLGMANSGLHTECSTQFFVLLQPAPWMDHKFVAFGQLIEGKETLEKIEAVPTWCESPNSEIIIYKAGIFNMDCHDIMINKGVNEYIDRHIEDLNELGEVFYEEFLEHVFLTAQFRELERLKREHKGEASEDEGENKSASGLHATKRFLRNKEDIQKQLQSTKEQQRHPSTGQSTRSTVPGPASAPVDDIENNEFDVETYDSEYEETDYQHQSLHTPSLIVKPKKPFYIPLTDVLYPGEKDSDFDLKRFLQGDYCLESDLLEPAKTFIPHEVYQCPSDMFELDDSDEENADSENERQIKKYLRNNVDRLSFAGGVVRNIGKAKATLNMFEDKRKSELITDDQLRRLRLAAIEQKAHEYYYNKKVSISIPTEKPTHYQIKRRQTGFVRPEDLAKIRLFAKWDDDDDDDDDNDDDDDRKVRISPDTTEDVTMPSKNIRRPTAFVPKSAVIDEDDDDDEDSDNKQKVHMAPDTMEDIRKPSKQLRRPTAFVPKNAVIDEDDNDDDEDDLDSKQKVQIAPDTSEDVTMPSKNIRRGTTFVPKSAISDEDDDDDDEDDTNDKVKVHIAAITTEPSAHHGKRRATTFVHASVDDDDDDDDDDDSDDLVDDNVNDEVDDRVDEHADERVDDHADNLSDDNKAYDFEEPNIRQSALVRLFEELKSSDEPPTLKNYVPMSERQPKTLLTFSSHYRIKSDSEDNREQHRHRYMRHSVTVDNSYENALNIQHGKKLARKISSDYAKTIDQIERKLDNSIRSVEFAKKRPTLSVNEYQMKNRKYQEEHRSSVSPIKYKGLRMPGDTPLHSHENLHPDKEKGKEKSHKTHRRHHSKQTTLKSIV